jgi:hypothetical protein
MDQQIILPSCRGMRRQTEISRLVRTFFVHFFSTEYLGLPVTFQLEDILVVLQLPLLGISLLFYDVPMSQLQLTSKRCEILEAHHKTFSTFLLVVVQGPCSFQVFRSIWLTILKGWNYVFSWGDDLQETNICTVVTTWLLWYTYCFNLVSSFKLTFSHLNEEPQSVSHILFHRGSN